MNTPGAANIDMYHSVSRVIHPRDTMFRRDGEDEYFQVGRNAITLVLNILNFHNVPSPDVICDLRVVGEE